MTNGRLTYSLSSTVVQFENIRAFLTFSGRFILFILVASARVGKKTHIVLPLMCSLLKYLIVSNQYKYKLVKMTRQKFMWNVGAKCYFSLQKYQHEA